MGCCFLLGNEIIIKGCVTVRGVGWDEVLLLLFGEVVSVRFWVTALGIGGCART